MDKQYIPPALGFVFAMTAFSASNAWGQCVRPYFDCDKIAVKSSMCFQETYDVTLLLSAAGTADYNATPGGSFKLILGTTEYPIANPRSLRPGNINPLIRPGSYTLQYTGSGGTADNLPWTINAVPNVDTAPQNACDGQAFNVSMRNTNADVIGSISFAWSILRNNVTGGVAQTNENVSTNGVTTDDGDAATNDALLPYASAQTLNLIRGNITSWATYTITPIARTSGCKGRPTPLIVNVRFSPTIIPPQLPPPVCDGTPVSLSPVIGNLPAGAIGSFAVTVVKPDEVTIDDPIEENVNIPIQTLPISQTLHVSGGVPKTVAYAFTPRATYNNPGGGEVVCGGQAMNVTVTVKPIPNLTGISPNEICAGTAPLSFTVGNYTGAITRFSYVGGGELAGLPPSGTHVNNNPTLVNTGTSDISVNLTGVTVDGDGCPSNPMDISLTVLLIPRVQITSFSLPTTFRGIGDGYHYKLNACHGDLLPTITFNAAPEGTYSWTNNQAAGGESGGNGGIVASLVPLANANRDGTDKTGIVTLISQSRCIGKAEIEVTVHPNPIISTPPEPPVICSGESASLAPDIVPSPRSLFNVTERFTVTIEDTGVSIGNRITDTEAKYSSPISQTFSVISGNIPRTATYIFTPWAVYNNENVRTLSERGISIGCKGQTGNMVVTVKPKPRLDALLGGIRPNNICPGTAPLPFVASNYQDTPIPTHFSYTSCQTMPPGMLVGLPANSYISGRTAEQGPAKSDYIYNNPTLVNPGTRDITVTLRNVRVKYGIDEDADADAVDERWCSSDAMDVTFTVLFPRPTVISITAPNPLPDALVKIDDNNYTFNACHGTYFPELTFTRGDNPRSSDNLNGDSNPEEIYKYRWRNNQGVGGSSGNGGDGEEDSRTDGRSIPDRTAPRFLLVNENIDGSDSDKTGVVTLTAQGCSAGTARILITVHPRIIVTAAPATQRLCPGARSQTVNFTDPFTTAAPIPPASAPFVWRPRPFEWRRTPPRGPTDESNGLSDNGNGPMGQVPVANTASATSTADFEVEGNTKVYADNSECRAIGSYRVLIDPKPAVRALSKLVCANASAEIPLHEVNGVAGTFFTWRGTPKSLGAADQETPSPGPINDVLRLPDRSTLPREATYTITPVEYHGCRGDERTVTITVMPIPEVRIRSGAEQTICSAERIQIDLDNNLRTRDIKYLWTVEQTGAEGGSNSVLQAAPGNDEPIRDVLTLTGTTEGKATYSAWAISEIGCRSLNSVTARIIIRGKPAITKDISSVSYCAGSNVVLRLETEKRTDLFKWYLLPPPEAPADTPSTLLTDASPYSGTTASVLTISNVPESYIGNRYQAEVTDGFCPNYVVLSAAAALTPQFFETEVKVDKYSLVYGEKVTFSIVNPPVGAVAKWLFGDKWYSEELSPAVHYYYQKGTFTPSVTLSMPFTKCSYTRTLDPITVTGEPTDGDIITGDKSAGLLVFPNPVRDILTVKLTGFGKAFLYNAIGQLQLEQEGNGVMEINFSDLPQGLFILKITNGEGERRVKIIKE